MRTNFLVNKAVVTERVYCMNMATHSAVPLGTCNDAVIFAVMSMQWVKLTEKTLCSQVLCPNAPGTPLQLLHILS